MRREGSDSAAREGGEAVATPSQAPVANASAGLAVRGSVSAGGSMRAAALAAARGEPLPDDVVEQLEQLQPQLNPQLNPKSNPPLDPPINPQLAPIAKPANSGHEAQASPDTATQAQTESVEQAAPEAVAQSSPGPRPEAVAQSAPESEPAPSLAQPAALDPSAITGEDWPRLVSELDIAGMPLQLANHCTWVGLNKNQLTLQIEASSEHLHTDRFVERLQIALSDWFGQEMRIAFEQVTQSLNTPAKLAEEQAARDMAAAHDSIKLDPIVRQLIDQVDGAVDEASIRPLGQD